MYRKCHLEEGDVLEKGKTGEETINNFDVFSTNLSKLTEP